MRAGLLRESITFLAPVVETGRTGFTKKTFAPVLSCRAYRRKSAGTFVGVKAGEEFTEITVVFQVRFHPLIKDDQRISYDGNTYKIVPPLNRQIRDNTYIINCSKLDD